MARVDQSTPIEGDWQIIEAETVYYRTTPDYGIREKYGRGGDPAPEAIARAMASCEDISPQKVVVRIETVGGEFLARYKITREVALEYGDYKITDVEFSRRLTELGVFSHQWRQSERNTILTYYTDKFELRRAYIEELVRRLAANASDAEKHILNYGLYNETYNIKKQQISIKENSTVYLSLAFNRSETDSDTLGQAVLVWPKLIKTGYYGTDGFNSTLQIRVYNTEDGKLDYVWNIPSPLVKAYIEGNITKTRYFLTIPKYTVRDVDELSNISTHVN